MKLKLMAKVIPLVTLGVLLNWAGLVFLFLSFLTISPIDLVAAVILFVLGYKTFEFTMDIC